MTWTRLLRDVTLADVVSLGAYPARTREARVEAFENRQLRQLDAR